VSYYRFLPDLFLFFSSRQGENHLQTQNHSHANWKHCQTWQSDSTPRARRDEQNDIHLYYLLQTSHREASDMQKTWHPFLPPKLHQQQLIAQLLFSSTLSEELSSCLENQVEEKG
jgi:hypothetical protein